MRANASANSMLLRDDDKLGAAVTYTSFSASDVFPDIAFAYGRQSANSVEVRMELSKLISEDLKSYGQYDIIVWEYTWNGGLVFREELVLWRSRRRFGRNVSILDLPKLKRNTSYVYELSYTNLRGDDFSNTISVVFTTP